MRRNEDAVLWWFGGALCAAELYAAVFWQVTSAPRVLAPGAEALCWPFFEGCYRLRQWPVAAWQVVFALHALLGASALWGFMRRASWSRWVLLACDTVKLFIVWQDYQLRLNQHAMTTLLVWAFVFLPNPRVALRWLLLGIYFAAGLLKLDPDWLSAKALYAKPWLIPESLLPLACQYVVVLELVFIFFLLSKRRALFLFALGQLVLFHLLSIPVVSLYYPLLMLTLLSYFVLERRYDDGQMQPAAALWQAAGAMTVFAALQLVPHLYPGDSALTGQGRAFALHMFDARVSCAATAEIHSDGKTEYRSLVKPLPPRIHCDPLVFFRRSQALCREGVEHTLTVMASRASSSERPKLLVHEPDVCAKHLHYEPLAANGWIKP